jgi:hypothetical protein
LRQDVGSAAIMRALSVEDWIHSVEMGNQKHEISGLTIVA